MPRLSVEVNSSQLDEREATRFVADAHAGGISVFAGVTRSFTDGRETVRLSYDAYPEMAEGELTRIAEEVFDKLDVCRIYVHHRIGVVPAGEPSVLIAVSAPHRAAAFEGCRYMIDELKRRAPIWKKEHFADGSEEWVE